MALRTTKHCKDLGRKLASLYEAYNAQPASAFPDGRVCKAADLEKVVGIGRSVVTSWMKDDLEKSRRPHMVSPEHIEKLARLVTEVTHGRIHPDEAYKLWTDGSARQFRRRLAALPIESISEVLIDRLPVLKVEPKKRLASLGMIEQGHQPVGDELQLKLGDKFRLEVKAKKGRSLVVLGFATTGGWFWLAPGIDYDGKVLNDLQHVPGPVIKYWPTTIAGPHRIIVIELDDAVPPFVNGRDDSLTLSPHREEELVDELLDIERSGDWRWGECRLFVSKP
ncbi:hypothetical protein OVA03_07695 [Asticcacaulis sp. SL142]|uniref:hypothetical protein n=1 Tax=Asticcacaulis sp. SL142 TaxID=2995155 RepID=UPI00226CB56E|nr:hypothetical protein [Asticcacaulis sp. SL142]WAC49772.1 hypothetical protein OVA03_07695 [Asticcacaulis sp. SL142]